VNVGAAHGGFGASNERDARSDDMRLLRYSLADGPHLGAAIGDGIVSLAKLAPQYTQMRQIAAAGRDDLVQLAKLVAAAKPDLPLSGAKLLAPIERPGKYLGIGMNYAAHNEEAIKLGLKIPDHQTWFNKQTTCIVGPFDDIDPGVTEKLDYEVELGVVIGAPAKRATEADAMDHVFGYFVANDVSARDWQFHAQTFTMGKSFDTHGPIGPWIVTADEVPNPQSLGLCCLVNGQVRQSSNTAQMIFNIRQQIAYLSTAFTLETGDLLATGTPSGVGIGMDPPVFLQSGDVVRCEIDEIGAIENRVI
jgi:2-keto-4-pentenoate hydratase/2-oxohepta-3-ene-1,7-dioic acid hydratase in catechol pathway